jgi:UPF0755 protein
VLKKISIIIGVVIVAAIVWGSFVPFTRLEEKSAFLYLHTGKTLPNEVINELSEGQFIQSPGLFKLAANAINLWPNIRPGKYEIAKKSSLLNILRILRNHRQSPVNLVITKLRTPAQLASLIEKKFECDSAQFIQYIQQDSLENKFEISHEQLLFMIHPNTYTYYWNATPDQLLKKMYQSHLKFWDAARKKKAEKLGLTPLQVTTLASIVEEETLAASEKPLIASVYLNRLQKNMPLGADPTVKFATGNFQLKRILLTHIKNTFTSPYNTYTNKGLPPGPICTPQEATIDSVLNVKQTDYLFFCAAPGFTGTHRFSSSDKEHLRNARIYQQWLDSVGIR